jgi:hypothetical protein
MGWALSRGLLFSLFCLAPALGGCFAVGVSPSSTAGLSTLGTAGGTTGLISSSSTGGSATSAGAGSSGGTATSTGGSTGGLGCTIDGQFFATRSANPANAAQCCNPTISPSSWLPLFTKAYSFPTPAGDGGAVSSSAAIADLNQDGRADVVVTTQLPNPPGGLISVYLSNVAGFIGPTSYANIFVGSGFGGQIGPGDFNRDGLPDLVVSTTGAVEVLLNLGGGQFGAGVYTESDSICGGLPVMLDANGDGWLDLAAAGDCGVVLLLNDTSGAGTFRAPQSLFNGDAGPSPNLASGDFNDDGFPDLVFIDADFGASWLENKGGGFGFDPPSALLDAGSFETDLVNQMVSLPGPSGASLVTFGTNNYDWSLNLLSPSAGGPALSDVRALDGGLGTIVGGDFNGDGLSDLILANGPVLTVFLNQGNGSFGGTGSMPAPGPDLAWIGAGDLNGDGAQDLVILRSSGDAGSWEGWINTCGSGAATLLGTDGGN